MEFPKLVALDTDWTLWEGRLDEKTWGKGNGAAHALEDVIERVDSSVLRDKTNDENTLRVYEGVSAIISDILKNGASLALVSNNSANLKAAYDKALSLIIATNPADEKECPIIKLAKYHEVSEEPKVEQFRKIRESSGLDYLEMILFDDEAMNNLVRIQLGVSIHAIRDKKGLSWEAYQEGLAAWRRMSKATVPSNPSTKPTPMIIGYSGQSRETIDLVKKGEGWTRPWTCRWGFGLYITDHPGIAKFYSDWEKAEGREGWVCAVWVKDYERWMNMVNKVWIPENYTGLPQMDNRRTTPEETGWNQEDRDLAVDKKWGVQTPYVLFSRHRYMDGMPIKLNTRSNEMLITTQTMRSLVYVTEISDEEAMRTPISYDYHLHTKQWNIVIPQETKEDFLKHGETDIVDFIMKG